MCTNREKDLFKDLAHAIIEPSKICRVGQQAGNLGKSQCYSSRIETGLDVKFPKNSLYV